VEDVDEAIDSVATHGHTPSYMNMFRTRTAEVRPTI
jgi:hypothetical protein